MNTASKPVEPASSLSPVAILVVQQSISSEVVPSLSKEDLEALAIYNHDHLFLPAHTPLWENPLNDC